MKRPRLKNRFHPVAIIFTAIFGGALLVNVIAHKTEFFGMVVPIFALIGAIAGLVTAPVFFFAIRRKDWKIAIPAIYIPSLLSAFITSTRYSYLPSTAWTFGLFIFACILCWYFIPNAPIQRGLQNRPSVSRTSSCILLFLLIPIASAGYNHYINPPDLRSCSFSELTKCLTTNNRNLHHAATGQLSTRGWVIISQLVHHENANVRRAVAKAVKNVGHDNSVKVSTDYLTDEDKYVRMQAIWTIQFEHPSLLPLLEKQLKIEEDPLVLRALNETLTAMKKP